MEDKRKETFWESLIGFFIGGGEKQELRHIAKHLTNKGYRYVKRGQLQPSFASLIYSFYRQTEESRNLLNKFTKPETLTYAVLLAIVPEHIRGLLLHVEPNEIRMRSESLSWTALRDEIHNALSAIKEYFSPPVIARANDAYSIIYAYRTFCMYDFYLLLKHFNGNYKENDFSKEPHFSSAAGFSTIDLVADLGTAFKYFLMTSDWNVLQKFFMSISQTEIISRDDHGVLYQRATHMENDKVFLSICRLIRRDPKYEINNPIVPYGKIEEMLIKIFKEADSAVKDVFQQQKRSQVDSFISALFDSDSNLSLDYYSEKNSKLLESKKIKHFEYAEPIGYLRAYFEENITTNLKKFADSLTIKGKTSTPSFIKDFFQIVDDLTALYEKITKLDLNTAPTSPTGYRIQQAIKFNGDGYLDVNRVTQDINLVNSEASAIMRNAQNTLPIFKDTVNRLATDSENSRGELIENWKEIDSMIGTSSHEYLLPLAAKTEKMSSLISIFSSQT